MNQAEMIVTKNIAKTYKNGEEALKDISFSIHEGEIFGFLGPSGAGKTTTIKILTGQLKQSSGTAIILGKDNSEIDTSIYEKVGIVTDQSGVYEKMTVYDNMLYFAKILKVEKKRINELLKRVGLYEHKKKTAQKLSKGQGQRLVLARAILHRPKVLFLDEPTSGLDPSTSLEIHRMLMELKREGMAIFLTTHNMEEAAKLCDQISLLNDGRIVEQGVPGEICLKYNTEKSYQVLLKSGEEIMVRQTKEELDQLHQWMKSDQVETLHSCEPTLEDVFIAVTGRTLQ